jgi:hypothetical protein
MKNFIDLIKLLNGVMEDEISAEMVAEKMDKLIKEYENDPNFKKFLAQSQGALERFANIKELNEKLIQANRKTHDSEECDCPLCSVQRKTDLPIHDLAGNSVFVFKDAVANITKLENEGEFGLSVMKANVVHLDMSIDDFIKAQNATLMSKFEVEKNRLRHMFDKRGGGIH